MSPGVIHGVLVAALAAPIPRFDIEARGGLHLNLETTRLEAERVTLELKSQKIRLCCPRVTARMSAEGLRDFRCSGGIQLIRDEKALARAESAVFRGGTTQLVLSGEVRLHWASGRLRAPQVSYDLERKLIRTDGGRARYVQSSSVSVSTEALRCEPLGAE